MTDEMIMIYSLTQAGGQHTWTRRTTNHDGVESEHGTCWLEIALRRQRPRHNKVNDESQTNNREIEPGAKPTNKSHHRTGGTGNKTNHSVPELTKQREAYRTFANQRQERTILTGSAPTQGTLPHNEKGEMT